jgi:hypothetical protein
MSSFSRHNEHSSIAQKFGGSVHILQLSIKREHISFAILSHAHKGIFRAMAHLLIPKRLLTTQK